MKKKRDMKNYANNYFDFSNLLYFSNLLDFIIFTFISHICHAFSEIPNYEKSKMIMLKLLHRLFH